MRALHLINHYLGYIAFPNKQRYRDTIIWPNDHNGPRLDTILLLPLPPAFVALQAGHQGLLPDGRAFDLKPMGSRSSPVRQFLGDEYVRPLRSTYIYIYIFIDACFQSLRSTRYFLQQHGIPVNSDLEAQEFVKVENRLLHFI